MSHTSPHESQLEFRFGEYQSTQLISTVFESLGKVSSNEPWMDAATVLNRDNIWFEADLQSRREDEVTTAFSAAKFKAPGAATALVAVACNLTYADPVSREQEELHERQRDRGRQNNQKLTRIARTTKWDGDAKIRVVKVLNRALGDLGPIPLGSVVGYKLRMMIGIRLLVVGNLLLEDSSQRHNLDFDVRDWLARYLNRYFPGDGGLDEENAYLRNKWRNFRGGGNHVPEQLLQSEEDLKFFNMVELKEKDKLVAEAEKAQSAFGDWPTFLAQVRNTEELSTPTLAPA